MSEELGEIVLLPGLLCPAGLLALLERRLRERLARPTVALATGSGLSGVRRTAEEVQRRLDPLKGDRVDVVGFSLGGVVASYLLRVLDRGRRIRRVVTLGAPHRGTPAAAAAGCLGIGRALLDLRPGSAFLRHLSRVPVPETSSLDSLYGDQDWVVPFPFACLRRGTGGRNERLEGISHLGLLHSEVVLERVTRLLADAAGRLGASALPSG